MRRYLDHFDPLRGDAGDGNHGDRDGTVGVVVAPWFSTPVPWYSLMLGIGLARRGRDVTVIWDDSGFPQRAVDEQNSVIADVLSGLPPSMPVVRLSDGGHRRTPGWATTG